MFDFIISAAIIATAFALGGLCLAVIAALYCLTVNQKAAS